MAVPPPSRIAPLPNLPGHGPDWYRVALFQKLCWDRNMVNSPSNQWANYEKHTTADEAYFDACPQFGGPRRAIGNSRPAAWSPDWCSAFVNYCLHRPGYSHTGHSKAWSWLESGMWRFTALDEPRIGCVIVVGLPRDAHVGLLASTHRLPPANNRNVPAPRGGFLLLGGNQGNTVMIKSEKRALVAARDSRGNRSPYLWPLRHGGNCNVGVTTAAPHHCGHPHLR